MCRWKSRRIWNRLKTTTLFTMAAVPAWRMTSCRRFVLRFQLGLRREAEGPGRFNAVSQIGAGTPVPLTGRRTLVGAGRTYAIAVLNWALFGSVVRRRSLALVSGRSDRGCDECRREGRARR